MCHFDVTACAEARQLVQKKGKFPSGPFTPLDQLEIRPSFFYNYAYVNSTLLAFWISIVIQVQNTVVLHVKNVLEFHGCFASS